MAGRTFGQLSELVRGAASRRHSAPLSICFVTPELAEFHQNGGMGTAISGLIRALQPAGHEISVLYTGWTPKRDEMQSAERWRNGLRDLERLGVKVHFLMHLYDESYTNSVRKISYSCFMFLKEKFFDVVHFNDYGGNGYYSCVAKRCGAAFDQTVFVTTVHGPTQWARSADQEPISSVADLEQLFLEQNAIAHTDVCIGVSEYLLKWLDDRGVAFPARTYVHKNCHPPVTTGRGRHIPPGGLRDIVFFGRLDQRKGLDLFIAGAKPFLADHPDVRVSFFGKFSNVAGEHSAGYVMHRLSALSNRIRFRNRFDRDAALRELRVPGTLAVMPSHDENSPCVVVECQRAGIPFIVSSAGGTPELVADEDKPRVLFEPKRTALTEKLEQVWEHGLASTAPLQSDDEIAKGWLQFHDLLGRELTESAAADRIDEPDPLVTICITHYQRPHYLTNLINAIKAQTYPNIEIVLVDDGSKDIASARALAALERRKRARFLITIERIENSYLGAARNAGARLAKGEFLKFQDDDNLPLPEEVETLVRAAQQTKADVVTCFSYQFRGSSPPSAPDYKDIQYFPLGPSEVLGYLRNEFGDANALVRTATFRALGGFTEDYGIGCEDYELFARVVCGGGTLVCVPEPLFFYRVSDDSMLQEGSTYWNAMRGRRGFAEMGADKLKLFADLEFGRTVRDQTRAIAWFRMGKYEHGWLHQQLLDGEPNATSADTRVADLLGRYGKVEDAIEYIVQTQSIGSALNWMTNVGKSFVTSNRKAGSSAAAPIILDFREEVGAKLVEPRRGDLPPHWKEGWEIISKRADGLLVHPVGKLTTIASVPGAVGAQATRVTVRWVHSSPDGGPALVSIGVGDDKDMQSDWVTLTHEDGPLDVVLEVPPTVEPMDLVLRSRAVAGDGAVWSTAQFARIEFDVGASLDAFVSARMRPGVGEPSATMARQQLEA
ncbi:MAG TPA: glycosyltransferase [Stellaceae bacterium]|nr:glycosyltransferase [Stellaceae bacterium]